MTRMTALTLPEPQAIVTPVVSPVLTLLKGWARIGAVVLLCAGLAAFYVLQIATPSYRSSVTMMLEPQEPKVIDLAVVMPALGRDTQILNTQVAVLRSRTLVGGLVDRLALVEDAEFNAAVRVPSPYSPKMLLSAGRDWLGVAQPAPQAPPPLSQQREAVIDVVLQRLDITIEPESLVIRVAAETGNPQKTALILNELAETYVSDQLVAKRAATEDATRWLTERVVELKTALEAAEQAVRAAKADFPLATPEAIAEQERRLAALRLRRETEGLGLDIVARLDAEIEEVSDAVRIASEHLIALAQLQRETGATALLYETFLSRLKETSIQSGVQRPDVRILSRAIVTPRPHAPNGLLFLTLAVIIGGGLGAVWVLAREEWRVRYRTAEEVERATNLPMLATMPEIRDKRRDPLAELVRRPQTAAAEAIRTLRSSILLSNIDRPPQVITLTSSVSGEGKSTTTLMLAQTLAGWEKKVLVIEADVRAATFLKRFRIRQRRGILSLLAGLCTLDDVLFHPSGYNFAVIPGEPTAAYAADVFATGRFTRFLKEMRERYDYILIDTPPVLEAADARVIGTASDVVVYLARWNSTTRSQLRRGLGQFRNFGQLVTGVALSRAPARRTPAYASRRV